MVVAGDDLGDARDVTDVGSEREGKGEGMDRWHFLGGGGGGLLSHFVLCRTIAVTYETRFKVGREDSGVDGH